nr:hypothetical protein [Tanacetum cinerariifolium]
SDADKNVKTEVESMVNVTIQQALSSISLMTSPIIDLTSRPESLKEHQELKATTTDTTTTTTTTLPPPQAPQQSTTEAMMVKRIGELEHIMADLIQGNKGIEERLDSHGSRLHTLEQLDIPQRVSIAVSEVVTDAVDWAMQASLRNRFRDLPEADMKEILHQRMWESDSYKSYEDHMQLFEALEKSMNPSPSRVSRAPRASGSAQMPPSPPLPSSTNQESPSKGSATPSPSKTATSAEYQAWTTTDIRLRPFISLTPADLEMDEDMAPDKQAQSSDYEDIGSAHIPTVNLRQGCVDDPILRHNVSKPLPLWALPGQVTIQFDFFFNKDLEYLRYGSKGRKTALSISKMKAVYYPDAGLEQMVPDQFWIEEECKYDIAAMYGISHWWFQRQRFYIDRHTSDGDRSTVEDPLLKDDKLEDIQAISDSGIFKLSKNTEKKEKNLYSTLGVGFCCSGSVTNSSTSGFRKPAFVCIVVDTSREMRVRRKDTIGGKEERSKKTDVTIGDDIEIPNRTEIEMPVREAEKKDEAENEPNRKARKEETTRTPSSQPVEYYQKLRINEKLIEGLVDNHRHVASHSYIYPLEIAEDVLVKVVEHVYPVGFVNFDIKEDKKRPFILGTPFLTTANAVIKFDKGTITLRSGKSKISFHRIPESFCKIVRGVKNYIDPIAPTMTENRLVMK